MYKSGCHSMRKKFAPKIHTLTSNALFTSSKKSPISIFAQINRMTKQKFYKNVIFTEQKTLFVNSLSHALKIALWLNYE